MKIENLEAYHKARTAHQLAHEAFEAAVAAAEVARQELFKRAKEVKEIGQSIHSTIVNDMDNAAMHIRDFSTEFTTDARAAIVATIDNAAVKTVIGKLVATKVQERKKH